MWNNFREKIKKLIPIEMNKKYFELKINTSNVKKSIEKIQII